MKTNTLKVGFNPPKDPKTKVDAKVYLLGPTCVSIQNELSSFLNNTNREKVLQEALKESHGKDPVKVFF